MRKITTVLLSCVAVAAFGAVPAHAATALTTASLTVDNNNCDAGYWSDNAAGIASISASWTAPKITTASAKTSGAAFEIIAQSATDTVEAGFLMGRFNGTAFEEPFLDWPDTVSTPNDPINSGDKLSASIQVNAQSLYTMTVTNSTKQWSEIQQRKLSHPAVTVGVFAACVILGSDPSSRPIADFGTATVTDALVNGAPIGDAASGMAVMIDPDHNNRVRVQPSTLASGSSQFQLQWKNP